jgi:glutamate dehydrogenase
MPVADHPGAENEQAVLALTDAAAALLAQRADIPKTFVAALFARAVPEDFLSCQPSEVAAVAERAWSLLAIRQPGTSKIRFEHPAGAAAGDRLKEVSVLEIVNDDMPFLVDSVMAELAERGLDVRLVVHPVFAVARDGDGRLTDFKSADFKGTLAPPALRESFIHIHVARVDDDAQRSAIVAALEQVLVDIRRCVQDWRPMLGHLGEVIAEIKKSPPPLPPEEVAEAVQFLEWLLANNFTFLGIRHYRISDDGNVLEPQFETGLA